MENGIELYLQDNGRPFTRVAKPTRWGAPTNSAFRRNFLAYWRPVARSGRFLLGFASLPLKPHVVV